MRLFVFAAAISSAGLMLAARPVAAQAAPAAAPGSVISLADAIALARRSNPTYQSSVNQRRNAAAALRSATGAFLPDVNTSFGGSFREGKQQLFGGQAFGSTNNQLGTSGSVDGSLTLSVGQFADRRAARAGLNATEADISTAEQTLRANVTTQYMTVLQAQQRAILQDTLLLTTTAQLDLARARMTVGSGTQLDVQKAEVTNGQQRVAALKAHNDADVEKIRLFQAIGVAPVPGARFELTLPIALPSLSLDQIIELARKQNPALEASRYRQEQSNNQVSSARSQYYPQFTLRAGVSGYTSRVTNTELAVREDSINRVQGKASCIRSETVYSSLGLPDRLAQCNAISWGAVDAASVRSEQSKYPFSFSRDPYTISAGLSLPIFNGFAREQNVERAIVARKNAENDTRLAELRTVADVTSAMLSLTTSQQTVAIQEQNAATARLALSLAQQRYQAGAISLVDLVQSRSDFDRAETDRITAIYDFHRAFAQLEAAAGRPLR